MTSASSDGAAPEEAMDPCRMQLEGDPSSISAGLREALGICSTCLEAGDYSGSDKAIEELVDLLNGVVESPSSVSEEVLSEIHRYLSSPSADPMTVDALSLELPKVVVRFAGVSDKCRKLVEKIVDCLVDTCNPRDMLSILCEALDTQIKVSTMPINFVVLLRGLSRELSEFFPFCGLSYLGLVTGCDVEAIIRAVCQEDGDDFASCFSLVKDGAFLAVIWGSLYGKVEKAAGENVSTVVDELCKNQAKRWQAIGMVKYLLLATEYPWKTKSHCIELLLRIFDGTNNGQSVDNCTDRPFLIPSIFATLKAFEKVMIFAPDAALRKKSFPALRKVLSDIPFSERFDLIKALIMNTSSPDVIALLLDQVKEEVLKENCAQSASSKIMHSENMTRFWSRSALELVELILKPPKGGPPSLPEDSSPVLFFPLFSM